MNRPFDSARFVHRVRGRVARDLERLAHSVRDDVRHDPLADLRSAMVEPHGVAWGALTAADRDSAYDIQWVVPSFGPSSGGHINIFRFITMLASHGYRQRLVVLSATWDTIAACEHDLHRWYGTLPVDIGLGVAGFAPAHATFATGWQTANAVAEHRGSLARLYFVQDYEPDFYPASSESRLAEATYGLGLLPVTAGPWLAALLEERFETPAAAVTLFGCDDPTFGPVGDPLAPRPAGAPLRVLFYARHHSPRRLFAIGFAALEQVTQARDDVEVVFVGGDTSNFHIPFRHENVGRLQPAELAQLYQTLDLALVLGATNLSLLPGELVAAGCPVVLNDEPNNRWLLDDSVAYFAPTNPASLAGQILDALDDRGELEQRRRQGVAWSKSMRWNDQADIVNRLLRSLRVSDETHDHADGPASG